jgi:hypothetical protein
MSVCVLCAEIQRRIKKANYNQAHKVQKRPLKMPRKENESKFPYVCDSKKQKTKKVSFFGR